MAAAGARLWRVTDRASFPALRGGRRVRRGHVSVTYLATTGTVPGPRVAFQVGKASGGAVVRNRIRRRLRAALAELQRAHELPTGTYLLGGRPEVADQPWPVLLADVRSAVRAAVETAPSPAPPGSRP